ncbi:MAG: hypothetical protein HOG49_41435 [Candidatus Scalindua sp.]|nr:hypothetical protein [Candidatus Scalindua sp.]
MDTRTAYYAVETEVWLGKVEIAEYLCDEPFDTEEDCIAYCDLKGIKTYTIEEQVLEKVLFDDDLEAEWLSTELLIKTL